MNRTTGCKQFHSKCKSDWYKEVCLCHFLRFCLFLNTHMFSVYKSVNLQTCKSIILQTVHISMGERTGLVVSASDSGLGDPGSILGRVGVLFPWARDTYSPKVLVIPRNRWLRLNMTEKLFTGTLNKNQNKNIFLWSVCKNKWSLSPDDITVFPWITLFYWSKNLEEIRINSKQSYIEKNPTLVCTSYQIYEPLQRLFHNFISTDRLCIPLYT